MALARVEHVKAKVMHVLHNNHPCVLATCVYCQSILFICSNKNLILDDGPMEDRLLLNRFGWWLAIPPEIWRSINSRHDWEAAIQNAEKDPRAMHFIHKNGEPCLYWNTIKGEDDAPLSFPVDDLPDDLMSAWGDLDKLCRRAVQESVAEVEAVERRQKRQRKRRRKRRRERQRRGRAAVASSSTMEQLVAEVDAGSTLSVARIWLALTTSESWLFDAWLQIKRVK